MDTAMLILPRGVTGFSRGFGHEVPPAISLRDFARACHSAVFALSGQVVVVEAARYPRNHHRAIISLAGQVVAVLCNVHFSWIAFASGPDEPLRFVAIDPLATRLRDALPCKVLDLAVLTAPPHASALANLAPVERELIRHWRPRRLGDIIFNEWD